MDSLKILFLVPYPIEGASYRYRVHQFLPYLKKENISFRVSPFISSQFYKYVYKKGFLCRKIFYTLGAILRRGFDLLTLPFYDVVFIHVETSPFPLLLIERIAKIFHKPIIYDFDDAIFLERENSNSNIRKLLKSHRKTSKLISLSSRVLVCNSYLKDFSKQYIDEKKIKIFSTSVDTQLYQISKKENSTPVIGWIGSHTTYPYLKEMLPLFVELIKTHSFVLKIVGAPTLIHLPAIPIIQKKWSLEDEIKDFLTLDIGIYPLLDTPWAKGKGGFKALQYMAAGVPCCASNVGKNKEIIQSGVNGFLVNTPEEWKSKIITLLESPHLRKKFIQEGKKTVEQHYSLTIQVPKFIEIIKETCYE